MPEGPEIRRAADALARVLVGRPLLRVDYRVPRLARKARALSDARVVRVYPRGKALLIEYDRGLTHYSHNQLYGEWRVTRRTAESDDARQVRVVLATATHVATLYSATDIDLLGAAALARHPFLCKLGPDILERATTAARLRDRLADPRFARTTLASLLLDQRFVAGLGNYLRSEILFAAQLPPAARPGDLDPAQRARLAQQMTRLARQSYRAGGVTNDLDRARQARHDGVPFDDYRFLVYGRAGAPCYACGTPIVRMDAGGRGLFRCRVCQP